MAQYPIKMLKDENGTPFVPLVSTEALRTPGGETIEEKLGKKLEPSNLIAGTDITLSVDGNNITINNASKGVLIDNLTTEQSGVGSLDAHQGKVLKDMIPDVVNNLTTTSTDKALSAYQGYLLNHKVVPTGGTTGQVLAKKSDTDNDIEWVDQTGGSSAVIISSNDDDATIIEKLLSAEQNGKLVKPLFYESKGGGNENAGVYNFFQSYSDGNGKNFLFTLLLDELYEVMFTIGGGELQNVLTKEARTIPWQVVLGDTGWLYTSNMHSSVLGAWYNHGLAGALYGRKVGNTVQLNSVFRFDGGFDEPVIFQLNEAFRPKQKIYAVLLITDTEGDVSSATKCNISIDINGYIRIEDSAVLSDIAAAAVSLYLYGTIMYFV